MLPEEEQAGAHVVMYCRSEPSVKYIHICFIVFLLTFTFRRSISWCPLQRTELHPIRAEILCSTQQPHLRKLWGLKSRELTGRTKNFLNKNNNNKFNEVFMMWPKPPCRLGWKGWGEAKQFEVGGDKFFNQCFQIILVSCCSI